MFYHIDHIFLLLGVLTTDQAVLLQLQPQPLVAEAASATTSAGVGVAGLIATGVISVISSLTIFAVVLLGVRAREKRQTAKRNNSAQEEEVNSIPTPKMWSGSNVGAVRSLSSISRVNPTYEDDNFSLTSTNTDLSYSAKP